jgi:flagellar hook assembly protein FlgD
MFAIREVTGGAEPVPAYAFVLEQNYPNPFNPATSISFEIDREEFVSLRIYDTAGRLVRTLVAANRDPGRYTELWNGSDESGHPVASGVYFCRLATGSSSITKKMILLR